MYVIDIFSKYASVGPLREKKGITISDTFQKILNESRCKPSNISVDRASGFYSKSLKSWLEKSDIEMYSAHNERESVAAGRLIRTLKNKTKSTNISLQYLKKCVLINKLRDILKKYNNTYRTIKMKPVDVKLKTLTLVKKIIKKILNLKLLIM